MELYSHRTRSLGTENAFKIGPHISRAEEKGRQVIRLNLGEPDFTPPDWVLDEVVFQLKSGNSKYCDPQGILPLRQAIARQVSDTRGLDISPDRVCVFPGGKPSIAFSLQLYCNPGDEIIYPSPGFPIYESMVSYLGAVPVPLHLEESEDFTVTPAQLKELISPKTKLIILNFPSNPTGGVADPKQLEELAQVILSHCPKQVRVYSDEIYETIVFDNKTHASIASVPGMEEQTLIASGFSKSYAWTGGRIGYVVAPTAEEAQRFKQLNINYFSCIPPYNQEGARMALEHPDSRAWLEAMTTAFQRRRDLVVDTLNTIPGVSCRTPKGAFYAFPNIGTLCRELGVFQAHSRLPEEIKNRTTVTGIFQMFALYHHGVAVLDRSSFGSMGARDQHFIRISLASARADLEQGLAGLAAAGKDVNGFSDFMAHSAPELFRRTPMKRGLFVLILATLAGLSTLAFAGEKTLTLMTHDSFGISKPVLADFEKTLGAKVIILKAGDAGEALNKAILSKNNPLADIFYGVDNTFISRALDEDIFVPYAPAGLDAVEPILRPDSRNRLIPVDYGDVCLNYDIGWFTAHKLAPPQTLEDLLDPAYKGLTVVQNPATSSPGLAFLLATISRFGDPGYLRYWKRLKANDLLIVNGWKEAYWGHFTAASEGERPIVVSYASSPAAEVFYAEIRSETAPTGVVVDNGAAFRQVEYAGILKNSPQQALAQKAMDFILSTRFQEDIPLQMFVFPANGKAVLPQVFSDHARITDRPARLAPERIEKNRDRWLREWTDALL